MCRENSFGGVSMKRIFTMLMAVAVLGFVVAGCGGGTEEKKEGGSTDSSTSTDKKEG